MAPDALTLVKTRRYPEPADRIFRAFIDPAELGRWWGPRGFTTPAAHLDVREGGRYRITMQPPEGAPFQLVGEYREIRRPHRLAWTFNWEPPDVDDRETVVTLSLREVDGGTELRLEQGAFTTEARRALHDAGWGDSLERLQEFLSGRAAGEEALAGGP